MSNIIC